MRTSEMVVPMSVWFDFHEADRVFGGMRNRIPEGCGPELRQMAIDEIKHYFLKEMCAYLGIDWMLERPSVNDKLGCTWFYNLETKEFVINTGMGILPADPQQFEKATSESK